MPAGQPFTQLCHQLANLKPALAGPVDLHLHTTHSDGNYTPVDLVSLAVRSGLSAIAITDHDTISGVGPAQEAAGEQELIVIPGVEISCEHHERELHLLAYFVDVNDPTLPAFLRVIQEDRESRFLEMLERLQALEVDLVCERDGSRWQFRSGNGIVTERKVNGEVSLGRRTLAELLVQHRQVSTIREAFHRYLADGGRADVPKTRVPVERAIEVAHHAGGVTSWAHPPDRATIVDIRELSELGLDAVEVSYPHFRPKRERELREWCQSLDMAVTGGSDCHGPGPQAPGCRGITLVELQALQSKCEVGA